MSGPVEAASETVQLLGAVIGTVGGVAAVAGLAFVVVGRAPDAATRRQARTAAVILLAALLGLVAAIWARIAFGASLSWTYAALVLFIAANVPVFIAADAAERARKAKGLQRSGDGPTLSE